MLFGSDIKFSEKKRQADLLQKLMSEVQLKKTAPLRKKLEDVSNKLSESMKSISENPTNEKVKDFKEKLSEMNAFIQQYEKL